jgi:hypothetical protein
MQVTQKRRVVIRDDDDDVVTVTAVSRASADRDSTPCVSAVEAVTAFEASASKVTDTPSSRVIEKVTESSEMAPLQLQCDMPKPNVSSCLIDPLNLWKALPPVPKYIDFTAKHPSDNDSYNSADDSESSLSSGFVSEHDDGIPDDHMDWVKDIFPMTTRALKRAKIGTFVKQKTSPSSPPPIP